MNDQISNAIRELPLVDHHVHSVLRNRQDSSAFEQLLTEATEPIPQWMTQFDSQVGFAVRRHCAPILGLEQNVSASEYSARRELLSPTELNHLFLRGSNVHHSLVDTGTVGISKPENELVTLKEFSELSGQLVSEIVRLETIGEQLFASDPDPLSFYDRFENAVHAAKEHSVGFKSIIAYRFGFNFEPVKPSRREVVSAVSAWKNARMSDPVLLRFALWTGIETGRPVQLHAGYGDNDLILHNTNPVLLTEWLRILPSDASDIILLHCYPYHREAGYLAQVFNKVYFDVGLAVNYTGARSRAVVAESLELAPFSKILFSTDAWGLPELHFLGTTLWREAMIHLLTDFVRDGEWSESDAIRVANLIGHENASRLYSL